MMAFGLLPSSRGLLPEVMVKGAQRAALFNLGINVMISFYPMVDKWAHFAGGAGTEAVVV